MERYVMLLRGINVGGVRISMDQLTGWLEEAGFTAVHTLLATGNAVFDADAPAAQVGARVAAALQAGCGAAVPVLLYPAAEFGQLVPDRFPLEVPDGQFHRYLSFTPDAAAARQLAGELAGELAGQLPDTADPVAVSGPVLYWFTAKGTSTSSPIAAALQRLSRRHLLTTRNLNTARKVIELLRAESGRA